MIWRAPGAIQITGVLELCDGKQIVIPLSLYHPPGSISNFSEHEGDVGQGNNTFKEEKRIAS